MTTRRATKDGLLGWARRERAGWEALLAEVGAGRMAIGGAMGDWTFKDLLAHLGEWRRFGQAPLAQALGDERPAPPWPATLNPHEDQDQINATIHARTRDLPVETLIREGRLLWDELEAALTAIDEAALTTPGHFPWLPDAALGPTVLRDATCHYHQDHEADLRDWLATFPTTGG